MVVVVVVVVKSISREIFVGPSVFFELVPFDRLIARLKTLSDLTFVSS